MGTVKRPIQPSQGCLTMKKILETLTPEQIKLIDQYGEKFQQLTPQQQSQLIQALYVAASLWTIKGIQKIKEGQKNVIN